MHNDEQILSLQESCIDTDFDSHSQLESAQKRTVRSRVRLPTSSHDTGSGITWDVLGTNPHCSPLCTFCTQRERQKGSALQPCWDCSCLVTLRQCRKCLYMRTHEYALRAECFIANNSNLATRALSTWFSLSSLR